MDLRAVREILKQDEGEVLHAYQDHLGYWTIGYGRLIDKRRGGGITQREAEFLLDNDISRVVEQLAARTDFLSHPEEVQHALINMAFQLGVNGLMSFRKMWGHLALRDYKAAADEALDSRWATQTPKRAQRVTDLIRGAA